MLVNRMIRAARLDPAVFDELEHDRSATSQALIVVIIISLANGVGQALSYALAGQSVTAFSALLGGVVASLVGWVVWSFVTYFVGTSLFGGTATPGELLRCIGFAYTPNLLGIFTFIPCIGWLISLAGGLWALVAVVIAIRQALDFDTGKAIGTAIIGFFAVLVIGFIFALLGFGFAVALR
jgi:hypothetical protein